MVEVSVALAEALLLEKEGAALRKRYQQQQRRAGVGRQGRHGASGDPLSSGGIGAQAAPAGAAGPDAEMVLRRCWSDEKAAENQRRVDTLSKSLEASDIHDLQVLRRSLQRQADGAARGGRLRGGRSRGERSSPAQLGPFASSSSSSSLSAAAAVAAATAAAEDEGVRDAALDEDEQWRADVLAQRLEVVERAVERKGGWRSAVFLDDKHGGGGGGGSGQVNVDVDVEPWPAADAVLMLQTVKDALNVQLLEVSASYRAGEVGRGRVVSQPPE